MGHGIAQLALQQGYTVYLCGHEMESVQKGRQRICSNFERLRQKNELTEDQKESLQQKLKIFGTVEDGVAEADFIIEAVPENFELKAEIFRRIDKAAPPHAILASNTSTMSITDLAACTGRPEKVMGMHYFYPAPVMELVEVIRGEKTSEETWQFGLDYGKKLGKTVLPVRKDTPGFVANRLAAPVCVYNGLCIDSGRFTPEDIDLSMKRIGQKMGPMELADYSGIDVMNDVQRYYHQHLSEDYSPSQTAETLEKCGRLGRKAGEGYYHWPLKGRPLLDETRFTGKYDVNIPFFLQANEACKLAEEEVCTLEECDQAMICGYHTEGPVAYVKKFTPETICTALHKLADSYGKEIFRPSLWLREGNYRK